MDSLETTRRRLRACDPASHYALSKAERARIEAYVVALSQAALDGTAQDRVGSEHARLGTSVATQAAVAVRQGRGR